MTVVGDVNSTLACALVATKMQVDKMQVEVAHAEAGLRAKLREANVTRLAQVRAVVVRSTGDVSVLHAPPDALALDDASLADVQRELKQRAGLGSGAYPEHRACAILHVPFQNIVNRACENRGRPEQLPIDDLEDNWEKILRDARRARDRGADLVFPEPSVTRCPPEDLLGHSVLQ